MRYRVNLLDMWIDKVDIGGAVARIDAFVRTGRPHQIVTVNVDFLRLGLENPAFKNLINTADLAVADGMPLLWGARLLGEPLSERVTGVELILECATLAAAHGYKIFLLGAGPGVAAEVAAVLRARCPTVCVVGAYAPPLKDAFSAEEDERTVRLIQETKPDILFVAFGAPKQDEWISAHMHRLNVPVCVGVGGAFDMLAGRVRRAPVWMQQHGLEWAYRVMQEPTRLWKRYFIDDMPVFLRLMAQRRTGTPAARSVTGMLDGDDAAAGEDAGMARGAGAHIA